MFLYIYIYHIIYTLQNIHINFPQVKYTSVQLWACWTHLLAIKEEIKRAGEGGGWGKMQDRFTTGQIILVKPGIWFSTDQICDKFFLSQFQKRCRARNGFTWRRRRLRWAKLKGWGLRHWGEESEAPSPGLIPGLIWLNNFPHSLGSERQHVLIKFADVTKLGSSFNSEC